MVHELTVAAIKYNRHNILADIADADIRLERKDVIKVAAECGVLLSGFRFKIAAVYPTCKQHMDYTECFKKCMEMQRFRYEHFFDYAEAIEWLSK